MSSIPETDAKETIRSNETKNEQVPLHESRVGIWTMYSIPARTYVSKDSLSSPALSDILHSFRAVIPLALVWRFILDATSIGPLMFALYFGSSAGSALIPVFQLGNNAWILNLIQTTLLRKQPTAPFDFATALASYLFLILAGWTSRRIKNHTEPILRQRFALRLKKRILAAQTKLDMATSNNPGMITKLQTAISFSERSWMTVEGIVTVLSVTTGALAQISVLSRAFRLHWDVPLFLVMCVGQPLISSLKLRSFIGMQGYYVMVTNKSWLRMKAFFELGTNRSYKKEVLSGDLGEYINNEYEKEAKKLGDTSRDKPEVQLWNHGMFDDQDQQSIFQPLPLILFTYRSMYSVHDLNLSSLFLMQQASNAVEYSALHLIHSLSMFSGAFQDINTLYDVLDAPSAMSDGAVRYPEDHVADRAGMSIEFKSVCFSYSHSERQVLNNMSFSIPSGKLCVIVGENGCGKSTTVQLLTRLHDTTSGEILIDGRPIRDFTLSSLRSASSIMYQDYKHLPLTIHENILLGRPDSSHPREEVERASTLGGAYNLIQKLPAKFQTNIQPQNTGYSRSPFGTDAAGPFGALINAQKSIELSGGEWQRLALSRSFMKNSNNVKLLCYDEPSASLDPKAEQEIFERLRKLRGEKTMIFVTHRFGYLTKHADIILYMHEGTIVEHGSHHELLERKGEYSKMYNIQAQAFL